MILHTNVAAVKRKKGRGARSNKKAKREDVIQSVPLAITKSKVVTGDAKTPKANRGTKKPPNMHPVREWDGLVPLEKLLSTLTQSSSPIFFFFWYVPYDDPFSLSFSFFFLKVKMNFCRVALYIQGHFHVSIGGCVGS